MSLIAKYYPSANNLWKLGGNSGKMLLRVAENVEKYTSLKPNNFSCGISVNIKATFYGAMDANK